MTTAQILQETLDTLRMDGWMQGTFERGGRICLLMALMRPSSQGDRLGVCHLLERLAGTENLFAWNDTPGRTFAEVEALLEAAIAIAKDEERAVTILTSVTNPTTAPSASTATTTDGFPVSARKGLDVPATAWHETNNQRVCGSPGKRTVHGPALDEGYHPSTRPDAVTSTFSDTSA